MNRIIYPNRLFPWVLTFIIVVFISIWGVLQYLDVRQEMVSINQATTTAEAQIKTLKDTQIATTTTSEVDTSGWKTYRNEKYGFEVKYPSNWVNNDMLDSIGQVANFYRPSKYPQTMNDQWPCGHGGTCQPPDSANISIFVQSHRDFTRLRGGEKMTDIANRRSIEFTGRCGDITYLKWIPLNKDNDLFLEADIECDVLDEGNIVLDNMLSTLKFFESQTSNEKSFISQPGEIKSIVQTSNGAWVLSINLVTVNPNFSPGISGPLYLNKIPPEQVDFEVTDETKIIPGCGETISNNASFLVSLQKSLPYVNVFYFDTNGSHVVKMVESCVP